MQITHNELPATLKQQKLPLNHQVYLFFGEPFLTRQSSQKLTEEIKSTQPVTLHIISGDTEEPATTLGRLQSYSLLPGKQIFCVTESRLFHSKTVAADLWKKAENAHSEGKTAMATKRLHALLSAVDLKIDSPTPLSEIPQDEWKNLFDFNKPEESIQWADSLLFQTRDQGKKSATSLIDTYINAFKTKLPAANTLLLLAETVDKRHRLYKWIKKNAVVIDCSVTSGNTAAAQKEQKVVLKNIILTILAEYNKTIDPHCLELLFERVGFHPLAVINETEKLIHFIGEHQAITVQDINKMIGRSREDALYELTDALGKSDLLRSTTILNRLLNQGIPGLAILSTLRNYTRKHLIYRAIQLSSNPRWRHGIQAREFQHKYLPILKENRVWAPFLTGHPYALFINFTTASKFSCTTLKQRLRHILMAEYRLKGSPLPQKIILEELIFSLHKGSPLPEK